MWLQSPTNFILFTDAVIEENKFLSFAVNKYKYHDISMIIVFKQLIFALLSILRPLENRSTPLPLCHRDRIWAYFISHTTLIFFLQSLYGVGCILLCIKKEEHISVERKDRCHQSDQVLGNFENRITLTACPFSCDLTLFLRGTQSIPFDDPLSTGHIYSLEKGACFFILKSTTWDYYKPYIFNLYVICPQSRVNEWLQYLFQRITKFTPLDICPLLALHIPSHSNHPSPSLCPAPCHHQSFYLNQSCLQFLTINSARVISIPEGFPAVSIHK